MSVSLLVPDDLRRPAGGDAAAAPPPPALSDDAQRRLAPPPPRATEAPPGHPRTAAGEGGEAAAAAADPWGRLVAALRSIIPFRGALITLQPAAPADGPLHAAAEGMADWGTASALSGGWRIVLGEDSAPSTPPAHPEAARLLDLVLPGSPEDGRPPSGAPVLRIRLLRDPDRPFREEEVAALARLAPVLLILAQSTRGAGGPDLTAWRDKRLGEALLAVLDQLGVGLCLVDREMRPLLITARARRGGAVGTRHGLLAARDRPADLRLQRAVREVLADSAGAAAPAAAVRGLALPGRPRPTHALVTALRAAGAAVEEPAAARLAAVVLLPQGPPRHVEQVIQAMFGLSPAEARVAKLLSDGLTPSEAAERLCMRPNTLRGAGEAEAPPAPLAGR